MSSTSFLILSLAVLPIFPAMSLWLAVQRSERERVAFIARPFDGVEP